MNKTRVTWGWQMVTVFLLIFVMAFGPAASAAPAEGRLALSLLPGELVLDVGEKKVYTVKVTQDDAPITEGVVFHWTVEDSSVATIHEETGEVQGIMPGKSVVTVTATVPTASGPVELYKEGLVTVSGIILNETSMTLLENERADLPMYELYGAAEDNAVTWSSSKTEIVRVSSGRYVDALSVGTARITAQVGDTKYSDFFDVTVRVNQAKTISEHLDAGDTLSFESVEDEIQEQCESMTGSSLSYVNGLSVPTDQGILYLDYKSADEPGAGVAQGSNYYPESASRGPYIADITFVPNPSYTEEYVTIQYSGTSEEDRSFNGKIVVQLEEAENEVSIAVTSTSPGELSGQMFSDVCQRVTGSQLDYIVFSLPSPSRGTLYYDYVSDTDYGSKVGVHEKYYLSELDLITFVPAAGYKGDVTVYYTGYTNSGKRYTGELIIDVEQTSEEGPSYTVGRNGAVDFESSDFEDYCESITGEELRYVRFSQPITDDGTIYMNYSSRTGIGTPASETTSYYVGRSPRISKLTFVPNSDASGTIQIPFTGWDESSNSFNGVVEVHIRTASGSGDVNYTCRSGNYVELKSSDFNRISRDLTGSTLRYIVFQNLPDRSEGILYLDRTNSDSGERVQRNTKYYYSSVPSLSDVTFWADDSFHGSCEIPFEGTASNGDTFSGILTIDVTLTKEQDITYTMESGDFLTFDADDFDELCWDALESQLRYLAFKLPSDEVGTLYYNYSSASSRRTKVTTSDRYYLKSAPYLDRVAFVPDKDFTGTTEIKFTGYNSKGDSFSGKIGIYVESDNITVATVHYQTQYEPVTLSARDFAWAYSGASDLKSVKFGILPSDEGTMYYQYSAPGQYSWKASSGTEYMVNGSPALSNVSFVPKADFQGTVTIPYTATNQDGSRYSGDVVIAVVPTYASKYFTDLNGYTSPALAAVNYLYENRIVSGLEDGIFGPSNSIRRGDFALMLCNAFRLQAPTSGSSFRDVPEDSYYASAIHTLRALGIVSGTEGNHYRPDAVVSRQDAMIMVQRTLQQVGWSTTAPSQSVLYKYSDVAQISDYAQEAMAYAVQWNLLPNSNGQLAPRSALSRIDMAQILHRALTF